MLMRTFPLQAALVAVVSMGLLAGCGQNTDHQQTLDEREKTQASSESTDPHDVPLTEDEIAQLREEIAQYESAVEHIAQYQKTIQQETTQGEPAKAHRALDKLDVVLQRLPEAASNSGVPKSKWQEVNETAQNLRDLFNQVHANIDAGKDPNYGAVADEIDRGIERLAAIEPEPTE